MLLDFFGLTLVLSGVTLACYLLVGQILEVNGESMYPTLNNKEHILAEKVSRKFGLFKRGDVIVFNSPQNENILLVKRIIGLPAESVKISEGLVYIDGKVLNEPYLQTTVKTNLSKEESDYEIKLDSDSYFVMGDNRNVSIDSREWGELHENEIMGKALFVYKPITKFRFIK